MRPKRLDSETRATIKALKKRALSPYREAHKATLRASQHITAADLRVTVLPVREEPER